MPFTIGAKLGRGVVGACYGGRMPNGAPVVIKVITRRFAQNPELLGQILRDVQGYVGLRHKNVSATIALSKYDGRDVILYEPARGVSLETILKQRGRLDVNVALRIARDIGMALAHVHERGLAIGDLRPAKVYFDEQHGATLVDLGQARASCLASGFGENGLAFGHPGYLAPEVLQEGAFTPTPVSDSYALGIMFFELLNGRAPFRGDVVQVLHSHLESPLPPPSHSQEITPKLATWMLQMSAKRPSNRIPHGKAVVNALYDLLGQPQPFPEGAAGTLDVMSSGTWNRKVTETQKLVAAKWSESRIMKAPQVGPGDLLADLYASGLLEDVDLVEEEEPESEFPPPPPEPEKPVEEPVQVQIGKKISRGPLGATYDGQLKGHEADVVIKVITRRFSKHPNVLDQILEGMKSAAGIELSTLVPVLHVLRLGGRDVVVMKRARGRCLRKVMLQEGPQSFSKALNWIKVIGTALQSLQKYNLSHGDIRPEKIYVTPDGRAQLADLGFAQASCLAANYGQYGMYFGHPDYLAPEVLQEKKSAPDVGADMYSLGILLYELLCGKLPFQGADARATLLMHLKDTPPPPPRGTMVVPVPLAELMLRLMAKSPAVRPQTPKALIDAVTRCQKQVLLTTGLRQVVAVDEFDLADSGDESSGNDWVKEALAKAEKTGTWSRDKIGKALGNRFQMGSDLMRSEELDPSQNPFRDP